MKTFKECVDDSVNRLVEVRKRTRDLATKRKEHVCSEAVCAPRNERFYLAHGFIALPIMCDGVFLCRFGSVHVCTPATCTRYMENTQGVCPISGVSYGQVYSTAYNKEDTRTWYQKPQTNTVEESDARRIVRVKRSRTVLMQSGSLFADPQSSSKEGVASSEESAPREEEPPLEEEEEQEKKKKIGRARTRTRQQLEPKIKYVIEQLLFSHARTEYNDEVTQKHAEAHKKQQERYLLNCKKHGQFPNLIDLHTISNYYNNLPLPMLNIEIDHIMLNHYINVISQVWVIVAKYADDNSTKVSVEAVSLGTLYTLRQGLAYNGIQLIPKDPFMCQRGVLPIINDVVRFGFTKKTVTCGEKLIDAAYNRAMAKNVSKDEIMINFSIMQQQNDEADYMIPLNSAGKKVYY